MVIPFRNASPESDPNRSRCDRPGQSRRASAAEAAVNVCVGYGIAVALSWWLLDITPGRAAGVSIVFTVASLARSYALRRLFVWWGL